MSGQYQDFGDDAESDAGDFNPITDQSDHEDFQADNQLDNNSPKVEKVTSPRPDSEADLNTPENDVAKPDVDDSLEGRDAAERTLGGDDVEEDGGGRIEEDEDEDDEEDEDEDTGPTRKRRKRTGNQFIDAEAEVDDDDEVEDEEDEEREADFVADTHPDDEGLDAVTERDDRGHRELDMQRQREVDIDAEKEAERLRKKYGRNQAAAVNSAVTPQSYLVPSVNDPSIWGVKCKPGKEKEIVFAIMKRMQDRMGSKEQLEICSTFERGDSIPGFFYVEAYRQTAVIAATDGLSFAFPRSKLTLVPIGEMPDLLRVRKTKTLEPGMYVRIKRGKYQGDLAHVEDVMENGLEVDLRLIPRLDYGPPEDSHPPPGQDAPKRKRAAGTAKNTVAGRPPARMFSEAEAQKRNGKYLQQHSTYSSKEFVYFGEKFLNGFLHKAFKMQLVETEDVNPTLEEVTNFKNSTKEGEETLDLQALAATLKQGNTASSYLLNDMVEIFQGEQQGVSGTVASVHGDIISLKVSEGDLKGQLIEAPARIIRKSFKVGNHVTVTGISKYHGESGFVERIKDDRVTLLTDSNNNQITVFSKDLREADDSVDLPTLRKMKGFLVYDLVRIDNTSVGVVVKADRDSVRVLDQNSNIQTLPVSGIQQKIERRKFDLSIDRNGAEIRHDDTVREISGQQRQARVLHIFRSFIFLHDRSRTENSGVFVARNSGLISVAAQQNRANGVTSNTSRPSGSSGTMAPPPPKSFGRDKYLGKTARIRRGPYKGLLGIVKDANEAEVRLELHGKSKSVNVAKELLTVIDPETGQAIDMSRFGGPRPTPNFPMRTGIGEAPSSRVPQWDGARTPAAAGARTPGWAAGDGARTPAWAAGVGNKTPAWKQGAARPSAVRADGSGTAYGGEGARTSYGGSATAYGGASTWNPNNSTPFHPSSFGGARTPAAGAYGSAATPGGFAGDTPGGNYGYSYSTPAAGATPGAYAQTPGAGGPIDDGYED